MKLLLALFLVCGLVAVSQAGLLCPLCKNIVGGIEADVEGDETTIEQKANKVCDTLTFDNNVLDPLCRNIVDNLIETAEDDIKNKEEPEKVCHKIHLC
ncbi:hypothetical protein QR680_017996 [Steinernema hermaphroditum]|uniref:Saposin B-type domain-containing protein n=1 Tax=Steinernema hermaphroditum TaxID=289476 RepID=A0AA39LQ43_9BILA|nr:hypothetical protein QR680_017996 [Steinernema hermaphroditum]